MDEEEFQVRGIPPLPAPPKFEVARAEKAPPKELARLLSAAGELGGLGCLVDGVNPHPMNMPGRREAWMAGSLLMDSDLGKALEAGFGKRDGQVAGKYRRASVFAFETPSLLLFAVAEPGDRGSEWRAAPKDPEADVPVGRLEALAEAASALRQILVRLDEAHSPSREELSRNAPGFIAELRARALAEKEEAELLASVGPGRRRGPASGP